MAKSDAPLARTGSALLREYGWVAQHGGSVVASVRAVQLRFGGPNGDAFSPAECLGLIMAAMSRGWDLWNGDIQLVRYQQGQAASLVTNYLMFTAEAEKHGGSDYLPPEFDIKIGADGFPIEGRCRMRRGSWPKTTWRNYPVDGGFIKYADLAPIVKLRDGTTRLRATWAEPGSGRHMFAKTLEARVTRLVWADATRGLYLREEQGTFRMPTASLPAGDGDEPDVEVLGGDWPQPGDPGVPVGDGLDPEPRPDTGKCPKCGKPMTVREGKRGPFMACTGYPRCKYATDIPEVPATEAESEAQSPEAAPEPESTGGSTPDPESASTEAPGEESEAAESSPALQAMTVTELQEGIAAEVTRLWGKKVSAFFTWLALHYPIFSDNKERAKLKEWIEQHPDKAFLVHETLRESAEAPTK